MLPTNFGIHNTLTMKKMFNGKDVLQHIVAISLKQEMYVKAHFWGIVGTSLKLHTFGIVGTSLNSQCTKNRNVWYIRKSH